MRATGFGFSTSSRDAQWTFGLSAGVHVQRNLAAGFSASLGLEDDSMLIVATVDGVARIWNVTTGVLIGDTITTTSEMADADFSPDGKQIASTGDGNVVRIWDAATGKLLQTLSGYHSAYISHVVWIDQNRLVSDDWQGGVVLYARGDSGSFAAAKAWSTGGQALGIGVSPDKTTIVTGGADPANLSKQGFVFLAL